MIFEKTYKRVVYISGSGTDTRDGHVEGFAIFLTKKKMESFAKRALKMDYELVGSVD